MTKLKGGFVGPLGDDIPSIFPLVTGIIILISSIAFLSNEISTKNNFIELRKSVLSISDLMLQSGYISNLKFDDLCWQVKNYSTDRGYDIYVSLQKGCKTGIDKNRNYNEIIENYDLKCSSAPSDAQIIRDATDGVFATYPTSVDCSAKLDQSIKGVGRLNIILYPRK